MSDWTEVGGSPVAPKVELKGEILDVPNPIEGNAEYKRIVTELQRWHGELLKLETEGKLMSLDNPLTPSEYLGKLRLNANMLYAFMNNYIDILNELQKVLARKRQELYEARLAEPKASPSAAEAHAKNLTRIDEANVKQVENRIQQIKNEYERYNGICLYLHSKMKEVNTERIMG